MSNKGDSDPEEEEQRGPGSCVPSAAETDTSQSEAQHDPPRPSNQGGPPGGHYLLPYTPDH